MDGGVRWAGAPQPPGPVEGGGRGLPRGLAGSEGAAPIRGPRPRARGPCPSPPRASVPSLVTPMWGWPGGGGPCAPVQLSAPRHRLTRCVAHRQGPRAENHEPHEGLKACHWEHVASRPGAGLFVLQKTQKSCASHPGEEAAVTGDGARGLGAPSSVASNESCALAGAPQPGTGPAPRFSAPPREAERMRRPHSPGGHLRATEAPWGWAGRSPCTQLRVAGLGSPSD